MSGSGTLTRAMVADGLVDEIHLFAEGQPAARFTLAHSEAYDNGVLYLSYRPLH